MVTATPSISQINPNLLSFLVQHKVEINVAPINAQGGIGGSDGAAPLVIPEGAFDKLLQTFIVPGVLTSAFSFTRPSKFCSRARKIWRTRTGSLLAGLEGVLVDLGVLVDRGAWARRPRP